MISLLAGKPNASTFPLTSIQLKVRSPTDPNEETVTEVSGEALAEGLQYGPTAGIPSLIDWVYGLQEHEHGRKTGEGWRVSIGSGSQDVIYKAGYRYHCCCFPPSERRYSRQSRRYLTQGNLCWSSLLHMRTSVAL